MAKKYADELKNRRITMYAIFYITTNRRLGCPTLHTMHIHSTFDTRAEALATLDGMKKFDLENYGEYTESYDDWIVDTVDKDGCGFM